MATKACEFGKISGSDLALDEAIKLALDDANMTIDDIDTVAGFACGLKAIDDIEVNSLNRVFGAKAKDLKLIEVKSHVGEARAAASALSLAHASLMLSGDIKEDYAYNLDGNMVKVDANSLKNVLCISYAAGGTYTAVIIKK